MFVYHNTSRHVENAYELAKNGTSHASNGTAYGCMRALLCV